MSRKHKSKHGRREDEASRMDRPTETAGQDARALRLTPIKFGIGLGVVVLGAAALFSPPLRGRDRPAAPVAPVSTTQPVSSAVTPAVTSLPPPAPGTRVPLNDVDPVTGKPITALSPTTNYKGYVIGFCCTSSEGYKGAWARKSESEKDAFVRQYLK